MLSKVLKKFRNNGYGPRHRKLIRSIKANARVLIAAVLIVAGFFSYIAPRVNLLTLTYDYNKLVSKEKKLVRYNKMLKLELASIKSLARVERTAINKMGMATPDDKNIILVRMEN